MSQIDFDTKARLKRIFGTSFEGFTKVDQPQILNYPGEVLLGQAEITKINSIPTNEFAFNRLLHKFNENLQQVIDSTQPSALPWLIRWFFSTDQKKTISTLTYIFDLAKKDKNDNLKPLMTQLEKERLILLERSQELEAALSDLNALIESTPNKDDQKHLLRMNLLRQVYAFSKIRLDSMKQCADSASTALENARNFYTYTKPNLDFSMETRLNFLLIDEVMKQFNSNVLKRFTAVNFGVYMLYALCRLVLCSAVLFFIINTLAIITSPYPGIKQVVFFVFMAGSTLLTMADICCMVQEISLVKHNSSIFKIFGDKEFEYKKYEEHTQGIVGNAIFIISMAFNCFIFYTPEIQNLHTFDFKLSFVILLAAIALYYLARTLKKKYEEKYLDMFSQLHQVYLTFRESKPS